MVVLKRLMIWRWMIKGIMRICTFENDITYGLRMAIRSWLGNDKIVPPDLLRTANTWISNVTMTYQKHLMKSRSLLGKMEMEFMDL